MASVFDLVGFLTHNCSYFQIYSQFGHQPIKEAFEAMALQAL